nr:PREDICTED: uncharacterized protein LOC107077405 [Lepisosteus oculatus]
MDANLTDAKSPITTESERDITAALLPSGSSRSRPHSEMISVTETSCQPKPDLCVERRSSDYEHHCSGSVLLSYPAKVWDRGNKGHLFEAELKPESRAGIQIATVHFPLKSEDLDQEEKDEQFSPFLGKEVISAFQDVTSGPQINIRDVREDPVDFSSSPDVHYENKRVDVEKKEQNNNNDSSSACEEADVAEHVQETLLTLKETPPDERQDVDTLATSTPARDLSDGNSREGSLPLPGSDLEPEITTLEDLSIKSESCPHGNISPFYTEDLRDELQPQKMRQETDKEDFAEEMEESIRDVSRSENDKSTAKEHGPSLVQGLEETNVNSKRGCKVEFASQTFIKPSVEEEKGRITHRFLDELRELYLSTYSKGQLCFFLLDSGLVLSTAQAEKIYKKNVVTMGDGVKIALTPTMCSDYRYQLDINFSITEKLNDFWYRGIDLGTMGKFLIKRVSVVSDWRKALHNFLFLPPSSFMLLPYAVINDRNGFIYYLMQDKEIEDFEMHLKEIFLKRKGVFEVWLQFLTFCKRNQLQPHNFRTCMLATPQGAFFDPTMLGNMEDLCSFKKKLVTVIAEEPWEDPMLEERVASVVWETVEESEEAGEG